MSDNATNTELKCITQFISDMKDATDENGNAIASNMVNPEYIPEMWKTFDERKMDSSADGNTTVFTASNSCHYLMSSKLYFKLPPVLVKEEYRDTIRIAWPRNLAHHIVKLAKLKWGTADYGTLDAVGKDCLAQFCMEKKEGARDSYNLHAGNIPYLTNFSDRLPAYTGSVSQPWYYSMSPDLAFPLLYGRQGLNLTHRYEFRTKLSDLLRIKRFNNGKWTNFKGKLSTYLNLTDDASIPIPELWGYYCILDEAVKEALLSCFTKQRMYIRDMVICDSDETKGYGSVLSKELKAKNPAVAIFWVAENVRAKNIKNYANYTTDYEDQIDGWNPIGTCSLRYGSDDKFKDRESIHFTRGDGFSSHPCEAGYHAFAFQEFSGSQGEVPKAVSEMGAVFSCTLKNGDITIEKAFTDEEDFDSEYQGKSEERFSLKIRIMTSRHLTIDKGENGFEFNLE